MVSQRLKIIVSAGLYFSSIPTRFGLVSSSIYDSIPSFFRDSTSTLLDSRASLISNLSQAGSRSYSTTTLIEIVFSTKLK